MQPIHIDLAIAKNKQLTALATMGEGSPFYLHSSVDPEGETEAWLERMELTENTLFLVMGAGLGYHVEVLLEKLPQNSYVLLISTNQEIDLLRYVNKSKPLKWLNHPRFHLLQLASMYEMGVALADFLLNKMLKKVSLCRHFPAMTLAAEQYRLIETELVPSIEQSMSINFNVALTSGYYFFENYWLNFSYLASYHGIAALKKSFQDYPVIVVAAGPSLDKNIHLLKECRERAIILAAGTAISSLVYHGIDPDFIVVCDVLPGNFEVLKEYLSTGAALVASVSTNHRVIEHYPGSVYFFQSGYDYYGGSLDLFHDIPNVRQTVSVATGAVDFAVQCGAKTVVLLGQDLAYAGDKEYAQGTKAGGYGNLERILIPGSNGQMVASNVTFKGIIEYYNQYVLQKPEVCFINATEGGALIANMQQLTLQEVIDTVLPKENIDKRFIHKFSQRKQPPKKTFAFLSKLKVEVSALHRKLRDFVQMENILPTVNAELISGEERQEKLQKLRDFYTELSTNEGYCYIEMLMRPRLDLLAFQRQDGLAAEEEQLIYHTLLLGVQDLLTQFLLWTEQTIKNLQEKRGGTPKCKK